MKYYLGLDLSVTGTGAVLLDEGGNEVARGLYGWSLTRTSTVREKVERLVYIAKKIVIMVRDNVGDDDELKVGIENYAFGAKGAQSDLGEIQGTVKTQLHLSLNVTPEMVVASSARKQVLGKGRFSKGKKGKKEIIAIVRDLGFEVDNDNVADAYVIAECLRKRELEFAKEKKDE